MKFGALLSCTACGRHPQTEIDVVYSYVLSDHFFSVDDLTKISNSMLGGGPRPALPKEQEDHFRPYARQYLEKFGPIVFGPELDRPEPNQ